MDLESFLYFREFGGDNGGYVIAGKYTVGSTDKELIDILLNSLDEDINRENKEAYIIDHLELDDSNIGDDLLHIHYKNGKVRHLNLRLVHSYIYVKIMDWKDVEKEFGHME